MPYLWTLKHVCATHGLDLELVNASVFGGPVDLGEVVERGEAEVTAENYWGLQSFRARGVPIVCLATAVSHFNEGLFVRPDIATPADLNGQKFALRQVGPSQYIASRWLAERGIQVEKVIPPEREIGRWKHWMLVASGECAGCFVTNFYADDPRQAGLKELPFERYGFIGNVTLSVVESLIAARKADIQTLVSSAFEATRLFKHDRTTALDLMRGEPLRLLRTERDIPDEAALERVYEIVRDELSEVPLPTAEAIDNVWRMRLENTPELRGFNPLLMWDLSFAREAMQAQPRPA
jgi:hypothetical protein